MSRFSRGRVVAWATVVGGILMGELPTLAQDAPQLGQPDQSGVETLTRGPLHEAFAEVVSYDPKPGMTVPKQPPDAIEEIPPEERPDDPNAVWIPGYWGWDEDRDDFIWISGVWRVPPPECQWVPGYWTQADNGYQWTSGFWLYAQNQGQDQQAQVEQITYLPNPPETVEAGPTSPQPAEDQFWVPGCWIWRDRYVWRPGYWARIQPDWVWIPARYIWTPSGCVFIAGHWDYVFARRGLCFAPAYFQPVVYTRPAFRYVPLVTIDVNVISYYLFCRPRYNHYCFGDYYGPRYVDRGIVPWFELYHSRIGYDPFYVYNRWYFKHHHHQPDWSDRIRRDYHYRLEHEAARPPRTYDKFNDWVRRPDRRDEDRHELVVPLDRAKGKDYPFRLTTMDQQTRERMIALSKDVRDYSKERLQQEKQLREKSPQGRPERPERVKISTSPVSPERLKTPQLPQEPRRPNGREAPGARGREKERPKPWQREDQRPGAARPQDRRELDRSQPPKAGEREGQRPGGARSKDFRRPDEGPPQREGRDGRERGRSNEPSDRGSSQFGPQQPGRTGGADDAQRQRGQDRRQDDRSRSKPQGFDNRPRQFQERGGEPRRGQSADQPGQRRQRSQRDQSSGGASGQPQGFQQRQSRPTDQGGGAQQQRFLGPERRFGSPSAIGDSRGRQFDRSSQPRSQERPALDARGARASTRDVQRAPASDSGRGRWPDRARDSDHDGSRARR